MELDPAPALSLLAAVAAELDAVEAAMGRLDSGGYGLCAECASPLPDEALAADALRTRCDRHPA